MSTVVRDLIGLGTAAVLLIGAIALDHLLGRLLTGASMPGRGQASSLLPPPSVDPASESWPFASPSGVAAPPGEPTAPAHEKIAGEAVH
jgi:hypothetical protein